MSTTETKQLAGKVGLVTCSTSGIGLGIARAFAGAGMNVMLNGFGDRAAIEKMRTELAAEYGVQVSYSPADMTKPAEIAKMVAEAETVFGRLDVLVNNAGTTNGITRFEETPPGQPKYAARLSLPHAEADQRSTGRNRGQ